MKFLMAAFAYNNHVGNIALALHEAEALGAYCTTYADNYRSVWAQAFRRFVKRRLPQMNCLLTRRHISILPNRLIYSKEYFWEVLRLLANKLGLDERIVDGLWEQSEYGLDRKCAKILKEKKYDGFVGFEYGCLSALCCAHKLGKKSVVSFVSPHYSLQERLLNGEYDKFTEFLTPSAKRLKKLALDRNKRRDEELFLADVVCSNSNFVTQSLIAAGCPEAKIITVPLGSSAGILESFLPKELSSPMRFVFAGSLSVRKGTHYLLKAWKSFAKHKNAQLHFYGPLLLSKDLLNDCGENVFFHGPIAQKELLYEFQRASVLIFPTLCDGFGMVVTEALAQGLPVIATHSCGAADFIDEGKNGFLVPAADVNVLVERIEWCILNSDKLLSMRFFALESAKRWTWNNFRFQLKEKLSEKGLL